MKLPVALLLISLTLCCYSVTADTCSRIFNILNEEHLVSPKEYMESIAPFVTSDVMKTAAYEFKKYMLTIPQEHAEAMKKLMALREAYSGPKDYTGEKNNNEILLLFLE
ncbi:hypothetical protein KIL84_006946 [Mauremys mutica]|uniref:Uteroglobin n=1 Tax=Mauremys mutica TaxID=74926 RepID=A0A9D4AUL3_9SAUR|nr:hypothetical protein KIL84_006946 [Mauremys mutica]